MVTSAVAGEPEPTCDVAITGATLGDALGALYRQCGARSLYSSDLAWTRVIQPVIGRHTVREVLRMLLRDTALTGRITASGIVTISPRSEGATVMKSTTTRKALFGGVSIFLSSLMGAHAARAEAAHEAAAPSAVQEVIVTAERRANRIENVPMAVTAVTGETLDRAALTSIQDLGRVTPGAQINYAGIFTQPAIRGVTSLTNGIGNENNVAIYVDGFYVSDTLSINSDLANLASIEVLKGPQGTLYGRNATGGAILINTLAPAKVMTGKIEGSYGRFDTSTLSGYLSGPITDRIRFGVAASDYRSNGNLEMVDPAVAGKTIGSAAAVKRQTVRTKLQFDVTDKLTALLGYNYSRVSDPTASLFTPFDHVPPSLPGAPLRATEPGTASYNYGTRSDTKTNDFTLKLTYDTPIGTLSSYSGYTNRHFDLAYDFDGTYADLTSTVTPQRQRTYQQSLDYVVTAIDKVDLVVGGMYFNDQFGAPGFQGQVNYGPGRTFVSRMDIIAKTQAYALYADATWHLTDALSIEAGGRFSWEDKEITQTNVGVGGVITFPTTTRKASFSKFTPRASIRYELAPRTNVYASYSQGFRSGTFNASGVASPALLVPIRPEQVTAYEVGFKTARSNVRFDVAGFYYDYTDLNVSLLVPNPACPTSCSLLALIGNAPKAKIYGIDGQVTFTPIERLNITAGGSWLHARYGAFANAIGTGLNPTTGLNIAGQTQDWSGKQMARAPNFSGNLTVDYTAPVARGELLLSGNLNYSDSFVLSNPSLYGPAAGALAGKQRYRRGAMALLNMQATWTDPSGHYTVGVYGKNLTSKTYRLNYNGSSFGDYGSLAPPITYGVKLGYRF